MLFTADMKGDLIEPSVIHVIRLCHHILEPEKLMSAQKAPNAAILGDLHCTVEEQGALIVNLDF